MSFLDMTDPFEIFALWLEEATDHEPNDPNAMALASVSPNGQPSVRMVLLKGFDARGFVFYTNFESQKGQELLATQKAALCFHWKSLGRQVRIEGNVTVVDDSEADSYFASRPRDSQIGAWASQQSRVLTGRFELEARIARFAAKYAIGAVPRPAYWSGFRVAPRKIEFWKNGTFRLHERLVFLPSQDGWTRQRFYP